MIVSLDEALEKLTPQHKAALNWFRQNAETEHPWPDKLSDGTFLATKAKGIYKPKWTKYALSIKQIPGGPYPDRTPVYREDGSWFFDYFQEGKDPDDRDSHFTNLGLLACQEDQIPIGVIQQTKPKPNARYQVLGLAMVAGWQDGWFRLEGFSRDSKCQLFQTGGPLANEMDPAKKTADQDDFSPQSVTDARRRVFAAITRRRGQRQFRAKLLQIYGGKCAISECDVIAALEAAHVTPYKGAETNTQQNGILLRADIHLLWDLGLIGVEPETGAVLVSRELHGSQYGWLCEARATLPKTKNDRPSHKALEAHNEWAQLHIGMS